MTRSIFRSICLVATLIFLGAAILTVSILFACFSSVSAANTEALTRVLCGMLPLIAVIVVLLILLTLLLARRLARHIVRPLTRLDLNIPKSNTHVYEELTPLLERIASQQRKLHEQSAELQRKKTEFETATNHMTEGLVLLNEQGIILAINRSAVKLLGIDSYCIGQKLVAISTSPEMNELLSRAQRGEHGQTTVSLGGQEYQINASPTVTDNTVAGIALLIFDITEKEKAEKMRREFTANVSHELKTPLHTISGYAELLSGGMVKAEDVPQFSERIYTEARRMIALVEDIIKLSRLDEGSTETQRESIDLYALANETVKSLSQVAREADIKLTLNGAPTSMFGIRQFLSIIIFNLCDNAIKYNRAGGNVTVTVKNLPECAVLSVRDTGIGIPEEEQERIFERFYRVDKSHSKAMGGTGLGLSIVKHAAKLHNAQIKLHSIPDVGTTVTVFFPK
ncbi:MAG: PAS domain S-box protein [Clostridia bacterium]|nr:PAS domain S-box protein [Clostridia bacterium]